MITISGNIIPFIVACGGVDNGELPDAAWAQFLAANGAVGVSQADLEQSFLSGKGFSDGQLDDNWNSYWASLGFTGTAADCQNAYLAGSSL